MDATFKHQLELAKFPAGVQVTRKVQGENQVFTIQQGENGLEIVLTPGAVKMYGEGASVSLVLSHLNHVLAQGLPEREPGGNWVRSVFEGD